VNNVARHSASIDDSAIENCFLQDHVIGLDPRQKPKPKVDILSLKSLAQSKSVKLTMCGDPIV